MALTPNGFDPNRSFCIDHNTAQYTKDTGTTIRINSQGKVEIEAQADVTIKAQGRMELSAQGGLRIDGGPQVEIKGGVVKLN